MTKAKLTGVCGVTAALGLTFTGQVWAADAETKKLRQETLKERREDHKDFVQERKDIRQDRKEIA